MEPGMQQFTCAHCSHVFPASAVLPGEKVQCPSCGETFVPSLPPAPVPKASGGVFVLGAVLLAAVVILVAIFWNSLLKKREVRPPKNDEKKSEVWDSRRTIQAESPVKDIFFSPHLRQDGLS
jgi:hypothetical protein